MKWVNGKMLPLDAADLAQRAVDDAKNVDRLREKLKEKFRLEAAAGIQATLGTTKTGEELIFYQLNLLSKAAQLTRKENKGQALAAEIALLDQLDASRTAIEAWRAEQDRVNGLLDDAGTVTQMTPDARRAELLAVVPVWPSP